jgi:hypothetical protein
MVWYTSLRDFYAGNKDTYSGVYFALYPGYVSGSMYLMVTNELYVPESGQRNKRFSVVEIFYTIHDGSVNKFHYYSLTIKNLSHWCGRTMYVLNAVQ